MIERSSNTEVFLQKFEVDAEKVSHTYSLKHT